MDRRDVLRHIYRAALDRVGGRPTVRHAVENAPPEGPVHVLALGKAAAAMAQGVIEAASEQLESGLVVTKTGHTGRAVELDPRFHCLEAAHPIPDASSLEAGEAVVRFLDELPADDELIILLSGGASSLVESLPEGFGADHLAELNRWLLNQPLTIQQVNGVRRAVSRIKGGRLGLHLRGRPARQYIISDVPGDDPAVIGSGPFVPSVSEPELPADAPAWVPAAAARAPAPPDPDAPELAGLETAVIATNADARRAAGERARHLGLSAVVHDEPLDGDAQRAGERVADALLHGEPGVQVWGGETTVDLPENPGRGGRAQALALTAAACIEGYHGLWVLAAGTDGTDGPGDVAGAVVDVRTCFRGRQGAMDPEACLEAADSGRFLDASGDLLRTGPTGTNVMDLVIGYREG